MTSSGPRKGPPPLPPRLSKPFLETREPPRGGRPRECHGGGRKILTPETAETAGARRLSSLREAWGPREEEPAPPAARPVEPTSTPGARQERVPAAPRSPGAPRPGLPAACAPAPSPLRAWKKARKGPCPGAGDAASPDGAAPQGPEIFPFGCLLPSPSPQDPTPSASGLRPPHLRPTWVEKGETGPGGVCETSRVCPHKHSVNVEGVQRGAIAPPRPSPAPLPRPPHPRGSLWVFLESSNDDPPSGQGRTAAQTRSRAGFTPLDLPLRRGKALQSHQLPENDRWKGRKKRKWPHLPISIENMETCSKNIKNNNKKRVNQLNIPGLRAPGFVLSPGITAVAATAPAAAPSLRLPAGLPRAPRSRAAPPAGLCALWFPPPGTPPRPAPCSLFFFAKGVFYLMFIAVQPIRKCTNFRVCSPVSFYTILYVYTPPGRETRHRLARRLPPALSQGPPGANRSSDVIATDSSSLFT